MFSGIIMNVGEIVSYSETDSILSIKSSMQNVRLGDSISCSGVCLTIMRVKKRFLNLIFRLKQKKN